MTQESAQSAGDSGEQGGQKTLQPDVRRAVREHGRFQAAASVEPAECQAENSIAGKERQYPTRGNGPGGVPQQRQVQRAESEGGEQIRRPEAVDSGATEENHQGGEQSPAQEDLLHRGPVERAAG